MYLAKMLANIMLCPTTHLSCRRVGEKVYYLIGGGIFLSSARGNVMAFLNLFIFFFPQSCHSFGRDAGERGGLHIFLIGGGANML